MLDLPSGIFCHLYLGICAVFTLTTWCPRTTLCYQCSGLTLLCCILPGEICRYLYLWICTVSTLATRYPFELADLYKGWKNCLMNPYVSALFAVFLTEKRKVFSKRYFCLRDSSKSFFHSYNTTFLCCTYQFLCLLKTYQFFVIHEWPSVFFETICIIVTWSSFLTSH